MRNAGRVIGLIMGLGLGAGLFALVFVLEPFSLPTATPTLTFTPTSTATAVPSRTRKPTSTATPIGTFIPWNPVIPGDPLSLGRLELNVMRVQNIWGMQVVVDGEDAPVLSVDQQYLWVELNLRCLMYDEAEIDPCTVSFEDFGIRTPQGIEYQPLPPDYYVMENLFDTVTLPPGYQREGRLLFMVPVVIDRPTYLYYPRTAELRDQLIFIIQ